MLGTIRDACSAVRQAVGTRSALGLVLLAVLASPFILAAVVVSIPFILEGYLVAWVSKRLRGVGRRLEDPHFGPMIYQGYSLWVADHRLSALGGELAIVVPGSPTTGPGPTQHEQFREFVARQHEIGRDVQGSIFREY
jgi:hypothetical protein